MFKDILLAGIGSFLGGSARYIVSQFVHSNSYAYPWATFAVNVLGCFLIGLLWGIMIRFPNAPSWVPLFLMSGFCGGFTTFSAFSRESFALLQSGNHMTFIIYVSGSVLLGIVAVAFGYILAK